MRIRLCIINALLISACLSPAAAATEASPSPAVADGAPEPLTLAACYELSLKESELIAIKGDIIKEADGRLLQGLSIMLPHVAFVSTDMQEDDKGTGISTSSLASLAPTKYSERAFTMTQTLFSGFKAFAAIKGSKFEKRQWTEEKIRAEQLLLADVANAFYLVMELRADIRAVRRIEKALIDRIKELKAREALGRSRPSEVVNARAQLYGVRASLALVRNQEILACQLLEFLIGRPFGELADTYSVPWLFQPEEYYVAKAWARPDVRALGYAYEVAQKERQIVDSDFLPTVNFAANGYTQRTAADKGIEWDITLSVDVPIFEGTEVLGRSQVASLKAHEKALEFARAKRKTPFDIKDAYTRVKTALAVLGAYRKQFATAKLNYYLQRKDYERSLVNNLDVLASIQTLQDAQRNYIHALYEAKRLWWQLRVAAGDDARESLNDSF